MEIRAKNDKVRQILQAALDGNIDYLEKISDHELKSCYCNSGCTALHWAAGNNQLLTIQYLIFQRNLFDVDITAVKKSKGRTPLHYSCRNGCLETTKYLIENCFAKPNILAKHGVSPFQLAVWQNQLKTCQYLVTKCNVNPCQVNDFDCGAIHWLGICPTNRANLTTIDNNDDNDNDNDYDDGRDLLPLAKWLAEQDGINYKAKQRQGHSALHKAAWGGHIALIRYLRKVHNLWDDSIDDAGNYAADLADMANTRKHNKIAQYLRQECSRSRYESCKILGIDYPSMATDRQLIRKAYLTKAKQIHPDRQIIKSQREEEEEENGNDNDDIATTTTSSSSSSSSEVIISFDTLHRAYIHLMEENGYGNQSNPAHSLNLMLQQVNNNGLKQQPQKQQNVLDDNNNNNANNDDNNVGIDDDNDDVDSSSLLCFKARLVAVLLEYGTKGIDLSNIKKKWNQVWPKVPFPDYSSVATATATATAAATAESDNSSTTTNINNNKSSSKKKKKKKKYSLSEYLKEHAGDVIVFVHDTENTGVVRVYPKNCSQDTVAAEAAKSQGGGKMI